MNISEQMKYYSIYTPKVHILITGKFHDFLINHDFKAITITGEKHIYCFFEDNESPDRIHVVLSGHSWSAYRIKLQNVLANNKCLLPYTNVRSMS